MTETSRTTKDCDLCLAGSVFSCVVLFRFAPCFVLFSFASLYLFLYLFVCFLQAFQRNLAKILPATESNDSPL